MWNSTHAAPWSVLYDDHDRYSADHQKKLAS